jgi:hypothetical protein
VIEANLERRPELAGCFADNDPRASLRRLEVALGKAIPSDGSALHFLDEIQAAPQVLAKLRWFAEELPALPVIAAGSLLDFALRDPEVATPVGRITLLHLEPMGFEEFCLALEEEPLVRWLREEVTGRSIAAGTAMPGELHGRALELFRTWLLVGGMPAAVEAFRTEGSLLGVAAVQRDLPATLRDEQPARLRGRARFRARTARQLGFSRGPRPRAGHALRGRALPPAVAPGLPGRAGAAAPARGRELARRMTLVAGTTA